MKKSKLFLLFITMITALSLAGQVAVNTDGSSADASAMLDVNSSSKGILIPRVTQTEIKGITNPANGLMVFNTDAGKLYIYIATEFKWKEVLFGSGEILYPSSITIGTGGACSNTTVNGFYLAGCELLASQSATIEATVNSPGAWSISTDTLNGYSFSGNGIVASTGTVQLTLDAHGTPSATQTDAFTATVTLGGNSSCTFNVTVSDCDDGDACTTDSCDPLTGCQHTAVDCDDGNACTTDSCDPATGCQHTTVDCDDGDACTTDTCDPVTGCQHTQVDCDDGDPNTTDGCDPLTGCYHIQNQPLKKDTIGVINIKKDTIWDIKKK